MFSAAQRQGVVDESTPSASRMYDYYLGGTHNFAVDRDAAAKVIQLLPDVPNICRANRALMGRMVRYLAQERGIRQFLDLGSGIPTVGNVHEIAQGISEDAGVVYVDVDPTAVMHGQQLLEGNDRAVSIEGDLVDAADLLERIRSEPPLASVIDLERPVALLSVAVLQFCLDDEKLASAMATYRDALAPGSYMALCHSAYEGFAQGDALAAAREVYAKATRGASRLRTRAEILELFGDWDLLEPGLVWTPQWRPDSASHEPKFAGVEHRSGHLAGIAVKR